MSLTQKSESFSSGCLTLGMTGGMHLGYGDAGGPGTGVFSCLVGMVGCMSGHV